MLGLRRSFHAGRRISFPAPQPPRVPPRPLPRPGPRLGIAKYNPWSRNFQGSSYTQIIVQAFAYAVGIIWATNYVDDWLFPDKQAYASPSGVATAISKLKDAFPQSDSPDCVQVSTDPDALKAYGSSEHSYHPEKAHSVIVHPKSTQDVVKIVTIASQYKVPVVVYSGATSLEGHYSGHAAGSICVDMSGMDKILEIHESDSDLVCQAGARWEDINETLKDKGIPLFFPLDPGPGATIGGMVGTGCSGTNAVRYGTAKAEWFLNLTVVLPNGQVIKTRRRSRKSSAGFDLTKLFVGAEGTLGIVTEATLRLAPVLPTRVAMVQFGSEGPGADGVEKAVGAVEEVLNGVWGTHMQCIELLDDNMITALNHSSTLPASLTPLPALNTLFFKIQGSPSAIQSAAAEVKEIVKKRGATKFVFAKTDEEADRLWSARKHALTSTMGMEPGCRVWTTDVCVPVSKLPQLVRETKQDLAESGLKSTIVGHVGDGNFHALIMFKNDDELEAVSQAVHRLVHRAISLDGTCTGEHGVGIGKKEYLIEELGEGTVELMRTIKKAVDPSNILNPGKLYPDRGNKH